MHIFKVELPFYPPCEVKCGLQNEVSTRCAFWAWNLFFRVYGFYGVICCGVEGGGGVSRSSMVDEFDLL